MEFMDAPIDGVVIRPVPTFSDDRGWLYETFRLDEVATPYHPRMGYSSLTLPGKVRGPHEHKYQSDLFLFVGPGRLRVWLWDNREDSKTFRHRQVFVAGKDNPVQVLVPPGVAHAYGAEGDEPAFVHNYPNRLYRGEFRAEEIDEIRHEDDPETPFQLR